MKTGKFARILAALRGDTSRILMCPPYHFDVRYEINPWMNTRDRVDRKEALKQWRALYRVLAGEVGAKVEFVVPVAGLPDCVFTANAGLLAGNTFIASSFRHPQRAREEGHWQAWFESKGYRVVRLSPELRFEGEGDLLAAGDLVLAGYGFRSDREAVECAGRLLQKEVLALELADPWFYHLDTCACPLNDSTILYYPGAFTEEGRALIEDRFPDAIPVPEQEARRFACNSVVIDRHVVMNENCPVAGAELRARGFEVHEVDVSEFLKAGGGPKCLVLILERGAMRESRSDAGLRVRRQLAA
jgi:N-dimethylarginine dimethylaminohydrolase